MSRYLNRQSLIGCALAIGLLSGVPLVQAGEGNAEHAHAAGDTDQPATKHKTKTSESKSEHGSMNHGTMDHSKMNHESMDHDSNTKKAD
ncbi:hypothetical protein [Pseudomonas izuensis]|uniref:hypothetical protein n=1 Tax=Pseudomonas izuensis TaxID=2684212 RepID=UPI00135B2CF7|nr:hypothetical protein [Pseudomonas izuensis]